MAWGERKRGKSPLCLLLVFQIIQSLSHARKSSEQCHTWFPQFLAPQWDCTRSHHSPSLLTVKEGENGRRW